MELRNNEILLIKDDFLKKLFSTLNHSCKTDFSQFNSHILLSCSLDRTVEHFILLYLNLLKTLKQTGYLLAKLNPMAVYSIVYSAIMLLI